MTYTIKNRHILIFFLFIISGAFGGGWYYGHTKEQKRSEMAQNSLKNELTRITVRLNDTEYTLTRTEQQLITERQLRRQDVIDKETLKALNIKQANEITKLKLRIDTLLKDIEHNGEIIVIQNARIDSLGIMQPTVAQKAIRLPFDFYKKDSWLDLKGRFDDNGKLSIDLKMGVDVDVITGVAKTKERTVNILTDNPYINTINVRSYKTDVQKPKKMGIGAVVGYGICRNQVSPFVGIGISYNVFTF